MPLQLRKTDCTKLDLDSIKKHIRTEEDVQLFKGTTGYKYYMIFLGRLCEAVAGQPLLTASEIEAASQVRDGICLTVEMLDTMARWIEEIPPLQSPQRFGNLAFRTWGQRLQQVRQFRSSAYHRS
jgi:serine/threonine-protein phosphatase 2A activator